MYIQLDRDEQEIAKMTLLEIAQHMDIGQLQKDYASCYGVLTDAGMPVWKSYSDGHRLLTCSHRLRDFIRRIDEARQEAALLRRELIGLRGEEYRKKQLIEQCHKLVDSRESGPWKSDPMVCPICEQVVPCKCLAQDIRKTLEGFEEIPGG